MLFALAEAKVAGYLAKNHTVPKYILERIRYAEGTAAKRQSKSYKTEQNRKNNEEISM